MEVFEISKEMPVIRIYGLPKEITEKELNEAEETIQKKVANTKWLPITPRQIAVLFIPDMREKKTGEIIVVEIGNMLDDEKLTSALLFRIAEKVGDFFLIASRAESETSLDSAIYFMIRSCNDSIPQILSFELDIEINTDLRIAYCVLRIAFSFGFRVSGLRV